MFAVLATALLALSGPLVGRSPHLRAPRPILLEPPAVVDPPLVVEPAVPSAAPCEFRFRLRNSQRLEGIKVNDKCVKLAGDTYVVQLPALQQAQPPLPQSTTH